MMYNIKEGQHVLLIWDSIDNSVGNLQNTVQDIQNIIGLSPKVAVEQRDRLSMTTHPDSTFDVVLSGVVFPQSMNHSTEFLGNILRLVKPEGIVYLREATVKEGNGKKIKSAAELTTALKISGFVNISEYKTINLDEPDIVSLKKLLNTDQDITIIEIICNKPNFEVGSSSKLSFGQKNVFPSASVAAIWKLDDTIDNDIIDSNNLLDEEDLKKPDLASLKVCGTTGKRKACKDCSCGLAEELAGTNKPPESKTSSCGSCYLGDAFRCATCPYLGMPAFKPGEKIELSDRQLKADA